MRQENGTRIAQHLPKYMRAFEVDDDCGLDLDSEWGRAWLAHTVDYLLENQRERVQRDAELFASGFWSGMFHERERNGLSNDADDWSDLTDEERERVRAFNRSVAGISLKRRAELVDQVEELVKEADAPAQERLQADLVHATVLLSEDLDEEQQDRLAQIIRLARCAAKGGEE